MIFSLKIKILKKKLQILKQLGCAFSIIRKILNLKI
jgi:hypothetical protein